jgi:hypothetical protein
VHHLCHMMIDLNVDPGVDSIDWLERRLRIGWVID